MKNNTKITLALLAIVLILIGYIIFSSPTKVIEPFDETPYRNKIAKQDSITRYWKYKATYWETRSDEFKIKVDSLETLKSDVHENYDKQIKLNNTANAHQLDSFIRANWK